MSEDPYVYPGTGTLRNKLDIRDSRQLDRAERLHATSRSATVPTGNFDLAHLQSIHRHLFQDIYEWAGEVRTVQISKGTTAFQPPRFIATGMADVHRRLVQKQFLADLSASRFADEAAAIMTDVNYVHPFREGNGRAQLIYLKQLAARAGHELDLRRFKNARWIDASVAAQMGDVTRMRDAIRNALVSRGAELSR